MPVSYTIPGDFTWSDPCTFTSLATFNGTLHTAAVQGIGSGNLLLRSLIGTTSVVSNLAMTVESLGSTVSIISLTNTLTLTGRSVSLDVQAASVQPISIGAVNATSLSISNPACTTVLDATSLQLPNMPIASGANILFYSALSGALSYSPASVLSSAFWNTAGTNSGAGNKLGTNTTDSWVQVVNSVNYVSLSTSSYDVTAPIVNITSTAATVINASALNCDTTGGYSFKNGGFDLLTTDTLNNVTWANVRAYTLGAFNIEIDISSDFTITGDGASIINLGLTGVASINIGSATCASVIDATSLSMPNIPTAPGGQKMLMIDPTTFKLYISP